MYQYESVDLEPGAWNRGAVIDAIIRSRYSQAAVEAINNNYLDEPDNEQYVAEREALKTWRRHAKEIAGGLSYE